MESSWVEKLGNLHQQLSCHHRFRGEMHFAAKICCNYNEVQTFSDKIAAFM